MKTVRIEKAQLLAILKENRDGHRAQFEEALEGWFAVATETLAGLLANARSGIARDVRVNLPRPEDRTRDYDRAIRMLELSVDQVAELDEQEFAEIVQDDWGWRRQWLITNSAYSASAKSTAVDTGLIAP